MPRWTDRPPSRVAAAPAAPRPAPGCDGWHRWGRKRPRAPPPMTRPAPEQHRAVQAGPAVAACLPAPAAWRRSHGATPVHLPAPLLCIRWRDRQCRQAGQTQYRQAHCFLPGEHSHRAARPHTGAARPHVAVAGNAGTALTTPASLPFAGNRTMTLPHLHPCHHHQAALPERWRPQRSG